MTSVAADEPFGGDGHQGRRWLVSTAIVLAAHVVGIVFLADRIHITPLPEPVPPAVMIDLAPLPTPAPAPPAPAQEIPKPVETSSRPQEMPRPEDVQRPVEQQRVELPQETPRPQETPPPEPMPEPIPELPPEPEIPPVTSDVVIPVPKPPPPPPPPPKRVVVKKAPEAPPPPPQPVQPQAQAVPQALPSPPAPPAPTPPAPAAAPPMPTNSAARENYFGKLLAHLSKHKRYPRAALAMRHQGVVMLRFTLDRSGMVTAMRIERSSGFESLDNEVLQLMERAQPLPGLPDEIPGERLEVVVPIQFFLR